MPLNQTWSDVEALRCTIVLDRPGSTHPSVERAFPNEPTGAKCQRQVRTDELILPFLIRSYPGWQRASFYMVNQSFAV